MIQGWRLTFEIGVTWVWFHNTESANVVHCQKWVSWKTPKVTSESKKNKTNCSSDHYCNLSRFFWLRRYFCERFKFKSLDWSDYYYYLNLLDFNMNLTLNSKENRQQSIDHSTQNSEHILLGFSIHTSPINSLPELVQFLEKVNSKF